ncbi:glycosyltransferase family 2 protein [Methanobacterium sp.]|uniref:glycosyltransferase family 2 protein n=1 Tax=Methanobacterium sp. TaxID=2164 RepID=UPI003C74DA5A
MKPNVSIIILNWNGWKDTIECLESLYQINYWDYNVIVVDNASSDNSIKKIKEYCEGKLHVNSSFFEYNFKNKPLNILELDETELRTVKLVNKFFNLPSNEKLILIKNDENYGFAEGNNIGMKFVLNSLDSDYILLLNNDTVVDKYFLDELIEVAESVEKAGILGPMVYYYSEPDKITYIGGNINLYTGKITHPYLDELKNGHSAEKINYICGCSLLIKKEVVNEIGFLDPDYYLYYEDTDLGLKAINKDYMNLYVPKAKIWHKVSASINENSKTALYYGIRNHFLLIKKNTDLKHMLTFLPVFLVRKFGFSLLLLLKGNFNGSKTVLNGVYDAIRGKYGFKDL